MFRLLTTSLPAIALCLGAASAASAAPLEPLWSPSHSLLNPTARPGILPGGCYVPGTAGTTTCPSGWCGTGYPGHSLASDCPNDLGDVAPYWPGASPATPHAGSRPGAAHGLPGDTRPLPNHSWSRQYLPGAGVFEADYRALPSAPLQDELEYRRPRLRPRFNQPQRQVPGEFHILPVSREPVSREMSDWFDHDNLFRP